MKAPNKIYLCADAPRAYDWSRVPFEKGGNIEYLRKDALLEWAKAVKADPMLPMNIDKVIEKIESL